VVDSFSRIIRLGEGIAATGSISEAAIDRAIAALSICSDKIRLSQSQNACGDRETEACRAADNAESFRARVASETGIRLEVIDRETEATLAVIGCSPLLDPRGRGCHPVRHRRRLDRTGADRGGIQRRTRPRQIKAWMSIRSASSRWPRHFGGRDVTAEAYARMVAEVRQYVAPFAASTPGDLRDMHMLGTSGTSRRWLASLSTDALRPQADRRVWMNNSEVTDVITRLLGMSYQERRQHAQRRAADLVLRAAAILDAIRDAFPLRGFASPTAACARHAGRDDARGRRAQGVLRRGRMLLNHSGAMRGIELRCANCTSENFEIPGSLRAPE